MSTQQLANILAISAENPPPANATPPAMRAWAEGITSHTPLADDVTISRSSIGPYQGDLIVPEGDDASQLIIYYHGGGFFLFSAKTYRVTTTNLARAAGIAVFAPDYRLAPENPAPAANDAFGVYQWALKKGYALETIALAGDSAGGNLALATAVRARDAGLPQPAALVLFSPWLDFAENGASYRDVTDDPILPAPVLDGFKSAYLGKGDRRSVEATPFDAEMSDLPPTLVHVGSWERLRDDATTIVRRMKASGVDVELKIFQGMCHGWQLFAPMLAEGVESIADGARFIKAHQVRP